MIRALIIDRSLLIHGSAAAPFVDIGDAQDIVLKPNVKTAFALIASLAQHHDFKTFLVAPESSCARPGHLDILHDQMQGQLDYWFDEIYVEENAADKGNLFAAILADLNLKPTDVLVLDDSREEIMKACTLGCQTELTNDLYGAICERFKIT